MADPGDASEKRMSTTDSMKKRSPMERPAAPTTEPVAGAQLVVFRNGDQVLLEEVTGDNDSDAAAAAPRFRPGAVGPGFSYRNRPRSAAALQADGLRAEARGRSPQRSPLGRRSREPVLRDISDGWERRRSLSPPRAQPTLHVDALMEDLTRSASASEGRRPAASTLSPVRLSAGAHATSPTTYSPPLVSEGELVETRCRSCSPVADRRANSFAAGVSTAQTPPRWEDSVLSPETLLACHKPTSMSLPPPRSPSLQASETQMMINPTPPPAPSANTSPAHALTAAHTTTLSEPSSARITCPAIQPLPALDVHAHSIHGHSGELVTPNPIEDDENFLHRLFEFQEEEVLQTPVPTKPIHHTPTYTTTRRVTRQSTRLKAQRLPIPQIKQATLRIMKELGILTENNKLDEEALQALADLFQMPLSKKSINILRSLTGISSAKVMEASAALGAASDLEPMDMA